MILNRLLELVYPPRCLGCDTRLPACVPLELCETCRRDVRSVAPPRCPRCDRHSAVTLRADESCAECHAQPPAFHRAVAAFDYHGVLRDCLHRVKFDSHERLGRALGEHLAVVAPTLLQTSYDLVVPVPLHPRRRCDRGFNQAELLAAPVSRALGAPLAARALRRARRAPPQSRLAADARAGNVAGAFIADATRLTGARHVLLVDDVLTTGATANACAQALHAAGVARVDVLVLATN